MVEVQQVGGGKSLKEESENATNKTMRILWNLEDAKLHQGNKETNLIKGNLLQPAQQK